MQRKTIGPVVLLAIASVDQLAITMSQQGLSILSVAFKEYSHLGVAQMGVLFSTVAFGAVIGMIPAGLALDRWGAKTIAWISGFSILMVMGILGLVLPKNFWALEALLGLVGFFLPPLSLTGMTAISNHFQNTPQEGTAIGIRQAATPLGGILAASIFPWLVKSWSLSILLLVIAVNAGGWTMLFAWVLHPHTPKQVKTMDNSGVKGAVKLLGHLRQPLLVSLLLSPGQYTLLTYSLLDLHDRWHVKMDVAGPILALALFGGFVSRIIMGKLADGGRNAQYLMIATATIGIAALLTWSLVPKTISFYVIMAIFFALGAGLDGWNALLTTWVSRISSTSQRGMALGLTGMSGFIGIVLFLPIFGVLVRTAHSYRPAWMLLAAIYVIGILIMARVKTKTPSPL
ncbi:MAG: hypothetical protein C7B46_16060 [Sulfobacillus benefaciens]|uniref:Major facilitator superfamily (MFS) profile domain-containing protein n=1 Tax=Sulfobacillus benefaciens TaxID=453960 RepID=A0A2T2XC95_9FIRM|nr:MAG: hypothetical protein C7B46_16060 [Sulfobacillus benefaciens]